MCVDQRAIWMCTNAVRGTCQHCVALITQSGVDASDSKLSVRTTRWLSTVSHVISITATHYRFKLNHTIKSTLTAIIQKRRLMLFGHLARMDETADTRRILRILTGVHQSDWSRPVGRPYTSWTATLKSDLSLHNLTFEDAIDLALDKSLCV